MQKFPFFNQMGIVPRWTIFIFDLTIAAIAFICAYAAFYPFNLNAFARPQFALAIFYCLGVAFFSFLVFKLYSGIVRYTSAVDSIRILSTLLFNVIILFAIKLILIALRIPTLIPTNVIIIYSLFAFTGLTTYRTLI